jgi:hypothetical protein
MSASTGPKDSPENTHFSDEELAACVQEARRRQVPPPPSLPPCLPSCLVTKFRSPPPPVCIKQQRGVE